MAGASEVTGDERVVERGRWWRRQELWPWAAFVIVFGLMPVVYSAPYQHNIAVLICLTALMATGWNLLGGFTGQISLGHALFFGVGAYTVAVGELRIGLNPWLGMLLGAALAVAVSMIVGLPVFRLRGHYFSIATIAVGEIAFLIFLNWQFVGAAGGLSIPIKEDSLLELQFSGQHKWEYYYLAAGLLLLALIATQLILKSRTGYYLAAIREDQEAAASVGVPVARYKQIALSFSAATVAIAGAFFAQYVLFVDPVSVLELAISIQITIAAVLGGVKSMWGPVIGAAVLLSLTETARLYLGGTGEALNLVAYGLLVMLIAAFEPNGLIGLAQRFRRPTNTRERR
ncbi:MAG: branched-chain amino acid ABC transporter permease [Actinomycetota bacterium]|nr:branched-chain amino acid ABC transporter permease [Actinomycetota bacterium]